MYYEIYLDAVFIINFMLDFIIVKITGYIAKRKSTFLRCIAASAVSSCALCLMYIFFMEMLVRHYFIMMLIMNLITVVMVFYRRKVKICEILRMLAVYYAVSFLLGGLINMVCAKTVAGACLFTVPWWSVLLVGIICFMAVRPFVIYMDRRREQESVYCDVELEMAGKNIKLKGLLDTGNHLIEPISGKPVQVAELSALEDLFAADFICAVKQYNEKGIIVGGLHIGKGIRMVPFRAVGTPEDKLLIAVMADVMKIKNKVVEYADKDVYIALYDGSLARDGSYRILLHSKELIRERG